MYFGALRALYDPLSVYNEAIYNFYRTLKRWTTEVYGGVLRGMLRRFQGVLRGMLRVYIRSSATTLSGCATGYATRVYTVFWTNNVTNH